MKTKLVLILIFISQLCIAQVGWQTIDERFRFVMNYKALQTSYFEVSSEMFKTLAESKEIEPEFKAYIRKLSTLKVAQSDSGKLYMNFKTNCDLRKYERLMMKKDEDGLMSFYKRERKGHPNEFLLISDKVVIYIAGEIDLKSIGEFEQVMEIAGSAFDM